MVAGALTFVSQGEAPQLREVLKPLNADLVRDLRGEGDGVRGMGRNDSKWVDSPRFELHWMLQSPTPERALVTRLLCRTCCLFDSPLSVYSPR